MRDPEQPLLPHAQRRVLGVLDERDDGPHRGEVGGCRVVVVCEPVRFRAGQAGRRDPLGLVDSVGRLDGRIEDVEGAGQPTPCPDQAQGDLRGEQVDRARLGGEDLLGERRRGVPLVRLEQRDGPVAAQAGAVRGDVAVVAVGDTVTLEALSLGEAVLRDVERVRVRVGAPGLALGACLEGEA